jgi:hypothetical protein
MGAGKSSAQTIVTHELEGSRVISISFADNLKRGAAEFFVLPLSCFYDAKIKEEVDDYWGISPREMLQKLGTEGMRALFGKDFWIRSMMRSIECLKAQYADENVTVIVSDVRFPEECDAIKSQGGLVIRIERPNNPTYAAYLDKCKHQNALPHPSETSLDEYSDWSQVVVNEGTLEEFEDKIQLIVEQLNATK